MASFFSKLFGGGAAKADDTPVCGDPVSYKDLTILPASVQAEGQWRLAGIIVKISDGEELRRNYLRADLFASKTEADEFAVRKGRQIIDEQGERLFADGGKEGRA
jgi:hypothetical protein